jgi:uncharacterized protein (TIGR02611 family)
MTEDRSSIANRLYDNYMGIRKVARNNRALDATWRMIILVVGLSIVGIGIFFLLFPGPGWGAIILGLIILATEFAWARRALHPVRTVTSRLTSLATSDEYRYRRMVFTLVGTVLVVTVGYTYWALYGASMDGFGFVLNKLQP